MSRVADIVADVITAWYCLGVSTIHNVILKHSQCYRKFYFKLIHFYHTHTHTCTRIPYISHMFF